LLPVVELSSPAPAGMSISIGRIDGTGKPWMRAEVDSLYA